MRILLFRHGETAGNLKQRYVGKRTNEPLTDAARGALFAAAEKRRRLYEKEAGAWPKREGRSESFDSSKQCGRREPFAGSDKENRPDAFACLARKVRKVYISPMARCQETAEILFPDCCRTVSEGLSECDFGRFEYKNFRELSKDAEYQRFLDSGGTGGFPGGERVAAFKKRCADTFFSILRQEAAKERPQEDEILAFVVHGGTIMAVMERFALPRRDYFAWQVKNGGGFVAEAVGFGGDGKEAVLLCPVRVSVFDREVRG
ncbi:MAG: histidine phosphatase family protein [Lachnospiraceae bacterium]|nr:histidine phosphatase family protein [Lachnospiraceae bacterium]